MTQVRFKTAFVQFKETKYNYRTSVNGKQTDDEIIKYFKGKILDLGRFSDNVQLCIECNVEPCNFI